MSAVLVHCVTRVVFVILQSRLLFAAAATAAAVDAAAAPAAAG
jgi:hypothetical protein